MDIKEDMNTAITAITIAKMMPDSASIEAIALSRDSVL